jgi:hypothetical protein
VALFSSLILSSFLFSTLRYVEAEAKWALFCGKKKIEARELSVHMQATPESHFECVLQPVHMKCTIALNDFLEPPKASPHFEIFLKFSPIKGQMNPVQYPFTFSLEKNESKHITVLCRGSQLLGEKMFDTRIHTHTHTYIQTILFLFVFDLRCEISIFHVSYE